ncbi:hypothetical protein AB1Y20_018465 [Prymnesium parvum]|uniref:Uncharacterized protein n=1 Tax=Prymnesium parvum TaxID=97485 RepID=A0AB34JQS1_PRYPA
MSSPPASRPPPPSPGVGPPAPRVLRASTPPRPTPSSPSSSPSSSLADACRASRRHALRPPPTPSCVPPTTLAPSPTDPPDELRSRVLSSVSRASLRRRAPADPVRPLRPSAHKRARLS